MLTSFLLRFCLGLVVLIPSLAHAATFNLENPKDDSPYSGLGVISGWKCEASGPLTAHIYNEDMMLAWPDPIPLVYGTERRDVRANGSCLENGHDNVGFVAIWNWGNLKRDGTYTVVVQEDAVELARSTVMVTILGPEEEPQVSTQVSVPDFPTPGETTTFQWNEATQHLEAVSREPACRETLTMNPGETCRSVISLELETSRLGVISTVFAFTVEAEGRGCIRISGIPAFDYCYSARLPDVLRRIGISVIRNEDGSWTIDRFPLVDLGECVLDLTVQPGAQCSGSLDLPVGEIDFTFFVEDSGRGCIEAEVDVPFVGDEDIEECFDDRAAFQKVLDKIDDVIEISAFAAKNADGSWTILDFL
jgi:hypothetical protein